MRRAFGRHFALVLDGSLALKGKNWPIKAFFRVSIQHLSTIPGVVRRKKYAAAVLCMSDRKICRILHQKLHMDPYKMKIVQELTHIRKPVQLCV